MSVPPPPWWDDYERLKQLDQMAQSMTNQTFSNNQRPSNYPANYQSNIMNHGTEGRDRLSYQEAIPVQPLPKQTSEVSQSTPNYV